MSAYLKLTCPKHKKYQAIRVPRVPCGPCWDIYDAAHPEEHRHWPNVESTKVEVERIPHDA